MNKNDNKLSIQKIIIFTRPPQAKSSKTQIYTKIHKIPEIGFEDHPLTSFSGIAYFQTTIVNQPFFHHQQTSRQSLLQKIGNVMAEISLIFIGDT